MGSREIQNLLAFGAADSAGTPFSALLRPLVLTPVAATFTMLLSDGDAFFYNPSDVSLTVDDSPYEILRWRSVPALTFATPDATNARIDLIVATPAMVDTDLVARTILLDPVARTIASQNVNKTTNPASTIAVVTGTPAGSPVPPAVPAGAVALGEVLIPAAAANSASFTLAPRLFRRAEFPWSTMSGVISGCHPLWDLSVDAASASAPLTVATGITSQVLIDGEILDVTSLFPLPVTQDASNNPFGSSPGTDTPYYIYAVGGRHAPQGTNVFGLLVPVAIVESLTAPNIDTGRPNASITAPRGVAPASACVFIGVGYVQAGTTHRKPCIMDNEWVYIVGADSGFTNHSLSGTAVQAIGTLASRPAQSRKAYLLLSMSAASLGAEMHLHPDKGDGTGAAPTSINGALALNVAPAIKSQVAGQTAMANVLFFFNPANPKIWVGGTNLTSGDSVGVSAQAYEHRVPRVAPR